jgi:chromate transporter
MEGPVKSASHETQAEVTGALGIFLIFLRLGCSSFGGPIAHLGYFRSEFVGRRHWLTEEAYADLVALSQFVPGPASSQTGFALGLMKGGIPGGCAAWAGFTLPSAILMLLAAYGLSFAESAAAQGLIHGLKLLAVAVVGQAVWSMGRSLCPDRPRAGLAILVAALLIAIPGGFLQLGMILLGAAFGLIFLTGKSDPANHHPLGINISHRSAIIAIAAFALLLTTLPLIAAASQDAFAKIASAFYQAGALVFGGGHVVLPLLETSVVKPGWIPRGEFLAGYGAAQALPGPLFSIAAFLGAKANIGPGGVWGALTALVSIFLPGMLLLYGTLPFWDSLRQRAKVRAALNGVNAAVVGILGAALYQPIWTSTISRPVDASLALAAFAALAILRLPVLAVVALMAVAGIAQTLL